MTTATSASHHDLALALQPATPMSRRPHIADVELRITSHLERIEARLVDECGELGRSLDGLGEVLERAVGTKGRGGARWRPLLTVACAEACGPARGDVLDVAIAVEFTHTASLVLDDLPCMDDSSLRRGQPATHRLVGSAGAILLSVGLLSRAAELLGRQPAAGGDLCAKWGQAIGLAGMAGGQAMDVAVTGTMSGSARRLHRAKSTALPAFALAAGAMMVGARPAVQLGLEAVGRGLGWAHQLRDDAEDIEEDAHHGRTMSLHRLVPKSERIRRGALRRLQRTPGLSRSGRSTLTEIATRIVPATRPARSDEVAMPQRSI